MKKITWCAIGDSFTYLNDHLEETGHRLHKGYLTRTKEKLSFPVEIINLGMNGSCTKDWLEQDLVEADFYTILLGTNDWFKNHTPIGTKEDFEQIKTGSILGNLSDLLQKIRKYNKDATVIVMTPVERGDFIYLLDTTNTSHGSYQAENGIMLCEIAKSIVQVVCGHKIHILDLHSKSEFTPENAVYFKRLRVNGEIKDLSYPDYIGLPYDALIDPYPYPVEAIHITYDGLHPSDQGCEVIADLLAEKINELLA